MPQLPRLSRHGAFRLAHLDLAELEFASSRKRKLVIPRVLESGRTGGLLPSEVTVEIPAVDQEQRFAIAEKTLGPIWASATPINKLFPHVSTAVLFHLLAEKNIIWLDDPRRFPYLRLEIAETARKNTPVRMTKMGRMIGYAELKDDTPAIEGRYYRRFFRIKEEESVAFGASTPYEAIRVSTIKAGEIPNPGRD